MTAALHHWLLYCIPGADWCIGGGQASCPGGSAPICRLPMSPRPIRQGKKLGKCFFLFADGGGAFDIIALLCFHNYVVEIMLHTEAAITRTANTYSTYTGRQRLMQCIQKNETVFSGRWGVPPKSNRPEMRNDGREMRGGFRPRRRSHCSHDNTQPSEPTGVDRRREGRFCPSWRGRGFRLFVEMRLIAASGMTNVAGEESAGQ